MVHNHMYWIPTPSTGKQDKGMLYAASLTGTLSDYPSFDNVTITEAVEIASAEFPPRTAVRRRLY